MLSVTLSVIAQGIGADKLVRLERDQILIHSKGHFVLLCVFKAACFFLPVGNVHDKCEKK